MRTALKAECSKAFLFSTYILQNTLANEGIYENRIDVSVCVDRVT